MLKLDTLKPLYHVYFSLGSNMGNRFENLQNAVNSLFEEIGSIVKISSIYETPAMGFEGEFFFELRRLGANGFKTGKNSKENSEN